MCNMHNLRIELHTFSSNDGHTILLKRQLSQRVSNKIAIYQYQMHKSPTMTAATLQTIYMKKKSRKSIYQVVNLPLAKPFYLICPI